MGHKGQVPGTEVSFFFFYDEFTINCRPKNQLEILDFIDPKCDCSPIFSRTNLTSKEKILSKFCSTALLVQKKSSKHDKWVSTDLSNVADYGPILSFSIISKLSGVEA